MKECTAPELCTPQLSCDRCMFAGKEVEVQPIAVDHETVVPVACLATRQVLPTSFQPGKCPSCKHDQHVGALCGAEMYASKNGDDHFEPVRCSCSPEKAIKADTGKAAGWDLLAWDVIPELLEVYRYGLSKGYLRDSWRRVDPARYEDALARHMAAHLAGEERDPESKLRHIAHVAWNAFAVMALRK